MSEILSNKLFQYNLKDWFNFIPLKCITFAEVVTTQIKIHIAANAETTGFLIAREAGISCAGGLLTWISGLIYLENGNMAFFPA